MMTESTPTQLRPINVNMASATEIADGVEGIGPVLAERIVALRESAGPFASLDELVRIEGIGPVSLERLRPQLTLVAADAPQGDAKPEIDAAGAAPTESVVPQNKETPGLAAQEVSEHAAALLEAEVTSRAQKDEPPLSSAQEHTRAAAEPVVLPAPEPDRPTPVTGVSDTPGSAMSPMRDASSSSVESENTPPVRDSAREDSRPVPEGGQAVMEPSPSVTAGSGAPGQPGAEPTKKRGLGGGLLLVLLGGLLGVALTLLVAVIWSGTLDFAPRQQVEALDRNMGTMQANQDLAWQRIDELVANSQDLERRVKQLEALDGRVATLEQDLDVTRGELADALKEQQRLAADLESFRGETKASLEQVDGRLTEAEANVTRLDGALSALQEAFGRVEKRVQQFDTFLTGLRDLLIQVEGEATPAAASEATRMPASPELGTPTPSRP